MFFFYCIEVFWTPCTLIYIVQGVHNQILCKTFLMSASFYGYEATGDEMPAALRAGSKGLAKQCHKSASIGTHRKVS